MREFDITVDGLSLFAGSLARADQALANPVSTRGGGSTLAAASGSVVLFTNDPATVKNERANVYYCGTREQDVLEINERCVARGWA